MSAIIEVSGLHYRYQPNVDVLSGLDLSIHEGEIVGLLGRNGAGKTTLLHLTMGLLSPTAGDVQVFGLSPRKAGVEIKKRVGFVSELQALPPAMSVEQVLDYHRRLFPNWDDALLVRLLKRFPLPSKNRVRSLSKGQARQLALLCGLAHRPDLLILDEPGGGLDPAARREFLETSIQLLNESGTTILFSSHHMTDVERMASRIVLLDDGRSLIDAPLDDVREGYCLVSSEEPLHLKAHDRCLRLRQRGSVWNAVCKGVAADWQQQLPHAHCRAVPLEELFVELLGAEV
jgi:ABC-2 type transport system ATP-binding protein